MIIVFYSLRSKDRWTLCGYYSALPEVIVKQTRKGEGALRDAY